MALFLDTGSTTANPSPDGKTPHSEINRMGRQVRNDLERLRLGDGDALRRLTQLVHRLLARAQAYDLESEWDDIAQDVILAVFAAYEAGRVEDVDALYGYLRSTTRFKLVSRVRSKTRTRARDRLFGEVTRMYEAIFQRGDRGEAVAALLDLDYRRRSVVWSMYVEGRTQRETADDTGIPLGSLKRYAREGLNDLRELLEAS